MESKHFRFGHETGVIIIIGIIISILTVIFHNKDVSFLEWNNNLFFEMLLPLIVFTTGYNIRRRNFFENFVNISKFGLLGTFLTFVFYTLLTYALFQIFTMNKYDPNTGETSTWNLDFTSIAYMCSILTGSDIIAAVTLIKFDDQPKLFSIILGEGLFNDVVVIILYQTMKKISEDPDKDNISPYKTPLIAIYDFALLTIVSLAIGVFCGFSATLMTKKMRFLSHSAVAESSLLLGWAMLGYLFSEMI
jgi:sodium/hydrogen exchanger-like protein 6/7/sodium/hydrogen exchanger 8